MDFQAHYEALPYEAMPFPQTLPSNMAALARLHGCAPPDVETARVLELGCASGGNLIPLAARYPRASFHGFDLSERHVRDGRSLTDELGISNIEIRQADIAALDLSGQRYDYIICHGVFSWTPRPVQDAIFRICREALSEAGIAYVSYNVLPGWHIRLVIRDICRGNMNAQDTPHQQLERARSVLADYAQLADQTTIFGKVLAEEIARSQRMSDTHFMGEFLSDHNDPVTFSEFASRASAAGLDYVCDAAPGEGRSSRVVSGDAAKLLSALARPDAIRREQAADMATGRGFRRSILRRHGAPDGNILQEDALAGLHFACPLRPGPMTNGVVTFRHESGSLSTNDPAIIAALTQLAAVYPETRTYGEVLRDAGQQSGADPAGIAARLPRALLQTVMAGHLTTSTDALRLGRPGGDSPRVWHVARTQLRRDQDWVCSLRHVPVRIDSSARRLALLMDGTNTVSEIRIQIEELIASGLLHLPGSDKSGDLTAQAARILDLALVEFRRNALLVSDA